MEGWKSGKPSKDGADRDIYTVVQPCPVQITWYIEIYNYA
jgi:hypothetical protein